MTKSEARDIDLVRYPFTDLTTLKKRPAVILSSQAYTSRFGDVVIIPLTSQFDPDPHFALSEWRAAGLLKATWVKPIIGTLSTRLVLKRLGRLAASDEPCVRGPLNVLLDPAWIKP